MRTVKRVFVLVVLLLAASAQAAAPPLLPLQGVLTDQDGVPITTAVSVRFSLHTEQTTGTELWNETQSLTPVEGLFAAYLGQVTTLSLQTFRDHGEVWLEVKVGADDPMARLRLGSTPFAGYAEHCGPHSHPFAEVTGSLDWSKLTGVPAGFADGIDNDGLGGLTCLDGQVVKRAGGVWTCGTDEIGASGPGDITDVLAGTGLAGGGLAGSVTLSLDTTYTDARYRAIAWVPSWSEVTGKPAGLVVGAQTCSIVGHKVTGIDAAGLLVCAADNDSGGDITGVTAGTGLTGGGASGSVTVSLDTAYTDGRYWQTGGNAGTTAGTHYLGTSDDEPLELKVNGARALRLEPNVTSPIIIGGSPINSVTAGVYGATIAGGGSAPNPHLVTDNYGTIGGGLDNQAGDGAGTVSDRLYATVCGGYTNTASGQAAAIAGGLRNTASGAVSVAAGGGDNTASAPYASVLGGTTNTASGDVAFVGGGSHNVASAPYATIGGGGGGSAAEGNLVTDNYGTVGGGTRNRAGDNAGSTSDRAAATVGGGYLNTASGSGSTVGGGGYNVASATYSTVGGGYNNEANVDSGTVAGGSTNVASGGYSTVGGGHTNTASAIYATVPGGSANEAAAGYSLAAGRRAKANHSGAFVWADNSNFDFASGATNQFRVRATGGVVLVSGIDVTGVATAGVTLAPGAGTWGSISDRDAKEGFQPVDGREVLAKVSAMPMSTWRYKAEVSRARHLGPMAQDFHAAFGLGDSDKLITTIDANGVALAAIQGLDRKVDAGDAALRAENARLQAQLKALEARLARVEQRPAPLGSGRTGLGLGGLGLGALLLGGLVVARRRRTEG